jgi:hypothetical protein
MTDQQPSKPTLTQPNPRLNQKSIPGSTNHVRVHASHDLELGCYNSFTLLQRLYTSHDHPCHPNTHCIDKHPYTLTGCALGHQYKVVQWFPRACSVPADVSPEVSV